MANKGNFGTRHPGFGGSPLIYLFVFKITNNNLHTTKANILLNYCHTQSFLGIIESFKTIPGLTQANLELYAVAELKVDCRME